MTLDRDVTLKEAASLFGVGLSTLYRWRSAGEFAPCGYLPSTGRRGRVELFRLSTIAKYVAERHAQRTKTAGSQTPTS